MTISRAATAAERASFRAIAVRYCGTVAVVRDGDRRETHISEQLIVQQAGFHMHEPVRRELLSFMIRHDHAIFMVYVCCVCAAAVYGRRSRQTVVVWLDPLLTKYLLAAIIPQYIFITRYPRGLIHNTGFNLTSKP